MTIVLAHMTWIELGTGAGLFASGCAAGLLLGAWLGRRRRLS